MKVSHTIVFDFGGVLLDWDPRNLYRKLFDGDDAAMEAFLTEVDFYAWNHQQDMGRPFAEGVVDLSRQFPHRDVAANEDFDDDRVDNRDGRGFGHREIATVDSAEHDDRQRDLPGRFADGRNQFRGREIAEWLAVAAVDP